MQLLLIRHCETAGQAPEAPLTAAGMRDAEALVTRLIALGVDALYSSPYALAVASLMPFARATGMDITRDTRLRERAAAWFDDRTASREHTARAIADPQYALDGEECFADAADRG